MTGQGVLTERVEAALLAMNAAWSGRRVFGPEHPIVADRVGLAASEFGAALAGATRAQVLFLPGRVVVEDRAIPSAPSLLGGLFARMGREVPDCLHVAPGPTPSQVLSLIDAIAEGSGIEGGAIIGSFALRWLRVGADAASAGAVTDGAALGRQCRQAWSRAGPGRVPETRDLEALAGEIATAAARDAGSILPLAALKRHDEYTYVHAVNVGMMASALCTAVGMNAERTREVTIAALLHDVGKSEVPLEIMNKRGLLSPAERAVMARHPEAGARILASMAGVPAVAITVAYEHHLHLAGGGYPNVPRGWRPGLASQVVHIADVFDALRTHRPYRAALSTGEALDLMSGEAGRCYDRALFDVFARATVARVRAPERGPLLLGPGGEAAAA